jgi:probable rRNA maturation factor
MAILFFNEGIKFNLKPKNSYKKWLREIAAKEEYDIKDLNYIFCSDEYLHQINLEYLNHDTYTDIITFDNSDEEQQIEGDVFISVDRVKENAIKLNNTFEVEVQRVMSHGLLHLMGYRDKTKSEKELMRKMENSSINLFNQ